MRKKCCGICEFYTGNIRFPEVYGSCNWETDLPFWMYSFDMSRSKKGMSKYHLKPNDGENCGVFRNRINWDEYEKMGE